MNIKVLTDEQIGTLFGEHDDLYDLARAIEQAVLQSPEIQALKKDAERYRCLSSMATQQADYLGPIFRIDVRRTPQTLFNFDTAVDLAYRTEEEGNKCS